MKKTLVILTLLPILFSCSEKQPSVVENEDYLIRVVEYAFMGDCIKHEQMVHMFAASFCDSSDVQISDNPWQSDELCQRWLESYLGPYNDIHGNLVGYIEGLPDEALEKLLPDRTRCKIMLLEFCQNEYMPTHTVDLCVKHGWFDLQALEYTFDGLNAYDWIERHWREHVTVDVREVAGTRSDKDNDVTTYRVEYEVTFAPDKYDGKGGRYPIGVTFDAIGDSIANWHIIDEEVDNYK